MLEDDTILDVNLEDTPVAPEQLNYASTGQRLGTFVVDLVGIYFIRNFMEMGLLFIDVRLNRLQETEYLLMNFALFVAYYLVFEAIAGRTLGKMAIGTAVVNVEGRKPGFGSVLLRTISRLVPFEPFSIFDSTKRMWHDQWTNTYVVKTR